MMAHEYAHGLLHNRKLVRPPMPRSATGRPAEVYVEVASLHEGLADVFAMAAESAGGTKPWTAETLSFGAQARRKDQRPYRNHLHPSEADAAEYTADHRSAPTPPPAPNATPERILTRNSYFRSGVVSHAFALMAYGGVNARSHIGVEAPLGMAPAFFAFATGAMALGKNPTVVAFAHATLGMLALPAHRTNAACAWVAVGVLSAGDALAYGPTCHDFRAPSCERLPDGTYCDPNVPASAYTCRGHHILAGAAPCLQGYCQRQSGSYASMAKLDAQGALVCGAGRDPLDP